MKSILVHNKLIRFAWFVAALLTVACNQKEPLFERLETEVTGVTFANHVTESDSLNIISHTNMYNGGGVAVADFNNDGLQDLYFTGNMVSNELYLNEGGFKFNDVTREAGVAAENTWSSGVAVVDINGDGWMDIYVCATTYDEPERRTNLFYINQGLNDKNIPVFREMAAEYNLADTAHTTMAAFFDYDRDGDLDLFLMVNQFNRHGTMDRYHEKKLRGESETTDRLYRNEGGDSLGHFRFTDVSKEAGILAEGFGLGLNITDINRDGWKDIYIANDFITNDVLYVNNGDGTFTDKAGQIFRHTAHAAMGSDVADVNNDGHPDVVVVDMRPEDNYRKKKMLQPNDYSTYVNNERYNYDYQYVRNVLQAYQGRHPETGEPVFSDVGIFAGIAETDWSWAPLLVDFDNDGWRDLVVTNGFPKDITDHDLKKYFKLYPQYLSQEKLLAHMPSVKISNYIYRNSGNFKFKDVTERWGMNIPSFSNGVAQVDLNNDGALDLVVNNIDEPAFIFRNRLAQLYPEQSNYLRVNLEGVGENRMGLGTLLEVEYGNGKKQFHEHTLYRGYLSSVEPVVHFGLGEHKTVDKLTVTWPDGSIQTITDVQANQNLTLSQKDAADANKKEPVPATRPQPLFDEVTDSLGFNYIHQEWDFNDFNIEPLLPHKLSQYGPALSVGDANSDGLDDIYVSGAFEYKGVFLIQKPDGTFNKQDLLMSNNSENREEELGSLFFDADGDGDDDLYIVSGGYEHPPGDQAYQDRLFLNEGGRFILASHALPQFLSSGMSVRAADFDRDGDLDLFVGGRVSPYRYPEPVDSYLLENVSEGSDVRFEIANDKVATVLNEIGMVTDALWTDFNGDGWVDLVLAGEWMPLRFLKNESGVFAEITDQTGLGDYKGWWNSLCGGDFDGDGDIDYLAGNLGTNTYFRASDEHPVSIYAGDFDQNGMFDAVPSVYYKNRDGNMMEVPFHGRQNLSQQIPAIKEKFDTYEEFATATMDDILSDFETDGMLTYRASYMQSSYIENQGGDTFGVSPLPAQVQWGPVYGCVVEDVDHDGSMDAVLVGNDYGTELSAGRHDALNGLVLAGDGKGKFRERNFDESGFFVPGDAKSVIKLRGAGGRALIAVGQNRDRLKFFRSKQAATLYHAEADDASAIVRYKDGTSRKVEFYYGSSFLSASSRFISIDEKTTSLEVTSYQGMKRIISFENQHNLEVRKMTETLRSF